MKFLLCIGLLAALPVSAFTADEERAERERIKVERAQAEAAYAARERECSSRFVVSSCVDDARRERRQALERLRQQQVILDEAQRKQRAAQRMDDIRSKVSGDDGKRRESVAPEDRKQKRRMEIVERPTPGRAASAAAAPAPAASQSAADEATHRADYERRQQEARAHREQVERRNAERAAKGKRPANPLPVPASAPASG